MPPRTSKFINIALRGNCCVICVQHQLNKIAKLSLNTRITCKYLKANLNKTKHKDIQLIGFEEQNLQRSIKGKR